MKAIVLVGGFGTRLRTLTLRAPKQMLPVGGLTMLERVVAKLGSHGVDEVVLSLGYQPDAFTSEFPDGTCAGVRLVYAVEPEPLDTAGAIAFAARVAGLDERVLAVNGDVLTDLDVAELWARHEQFGGAATIALTPVEDPSRYGVVPIDTDGRVEAFIEKPDPGTAPSNWINAGTYVLEPSVLERIPAGINVSIERETFPRMLDQRGRLYAWAGDGYWIDIGTPEKYLAAHLDVLGGALGPVPVAGAQEVDPGIWLEPGAVVDPSTRLVPPVLVGRDAAVGPGAWVAGSTIGAGATVGYGARVTGSVLHAGAAVGRAAEVTDSVLGPGVVVPDAAVVRSELCVQEGS
jgi:NDP-sugar pyrophosphorylase family protein